MKNILILGAGRSSSWLIRYLLEEAKKHDWRITVGDISLRNAEQNIGRHACGNAVEIDVTDDAERNSHIAQAGIVISMLPPKYHILVAADCVRLGKSLTTASYISDEIKRLDASAKKAGIIILNECGLDPGIDHISAMQLFERIRSKGGKITSYESFTGGLVAPESDDNPWRYKFSWNPKNVVTAGQGVVKFIQEGRYKYIPYHKIFSRIEKIKIPGFGEFEGYANRDSLKYREIYGLHDIRTIYRGTLRRTGFCRAWDIFVQLGATDDSFVMEGTEDMTYRQFINSFMLYRPKDSVELKLCYHNGISMDSDEMYKLQWLEVFENHRVGIKKATPAQVLQKILEQKWMLQPKDKDMIIMLHKVQYMLRGKLNRINSYLAITGEQQPFTAMAKTVGLPLGIVTKLILTGKIKECGVHLPTLKSVYNPVLKELKRYDIHFSEEKI